MKIKTIGLIGIIALLLAACNGLTGASQTGGLGLEEIKSVATSDALSNNVAFHDEMDQDISSDWGLKVVSGLKEQLALSQESSHARIELSSNPNDATFIFLNKDKNYQDVVVQAEMEYLESSDTFVGVICRASEDGWYEFRINNQGYYQVLKYDQYLKDQGKNAYEDLVREQLRSPAIKTGKETNVLSLSCVGNQLQVFVNGQQIFKDSVPLVIEDDDFTEGTIGFGLAAYGSSTDISINWVETLKP